MNNCNKTTYQFVIQPLPEISSLQISSNLGRSNIASLKNRRDPEAKRDYPEYPTMRVNNRKRVGGWAAWNGIRRLADRMS